MLTGGFQNGCPENFGNVSGKQRWRSRFKGLFDDILIMIRKNLDDLLFKLANIWRFILPE